MEWCVALNVAAERNCGMAYVLSFCKGWISVAYDKGDKKGGIEAPFLAFRELNHL